jgi:hypothetical protein
MLSILRSLHGDRRCSYRFSHLEFITLYPRRIIGHYYERIGIHNASIGSARRRVNGPECGISFCVHTKLVREPASLFVLLDKLPERIGLLLFVSGRCHTGDDCWAWHNLAWDGGCQQYMQRTKRNSML